MTIPPSAPAVKDNTKLFGILGIVFSICGGWLGLVFAILSLLQAKKHGKPATLAYVAFGILALWVVVIIGYYATA
ncbi:hypothetical protein F4553_004959 [Allocatelliglobosispora scoriae]|uniref:DUF4190 domain-containing protein n=1 Tax=Allocatelliglobosispora scoriae TaxID=643052 RepID=A0A841BXY2_9ACTN|nr:hypothetical protein [Allocatelliglobosispora scoriae]MBB5871580.1 hypothetical protein [Allocatelliglobosispora scoriae]